MKADRGKMDTIPPAAAAGIAAMLLALALAVVRVEWAALPLFIFVVLCVAAAFHPASGFILPVVSRGRTGRSAVALTFDDGPDPATTPALLQLLDRHGVRGAFFVTGERAGQYGHLISAIVERGHDIGNHSYSHDPFLMLRRTERLLREISSTQTLLHRFGISPLAFRPPVGIANPKLDHLLRIAGLYCVIFSCRAGDFGNRRIHGLAEKIMKKVKADDIILLHDVRPRSAGGVEAWLHEVDLILDGLKNKGLEVIPLSELIARPVMVKVDRLKAE
ncbi:MAG: polysaccharide deacetylase family protein [Syntrophales bacterium]|jgi:peptidoglycan/xylan/chitin deacetylase (PgdA/CDA1 family)|nr:polysaccharide deacetylase family protein [Syntrophales bacterium]MCK9391086.1 polysaccharide deacetylase family protein [Syntrophales bacterium]